MVITFYTPSEDVTKEGNKVSARPNITTDRKGDDQKYPDNEQKQKRGYPATSGAAG